MLYCLAPFLARGGVGASVHQSRIINKGSAVEGKRTPWILPLFVTTQLSLEGLRPTSLPASGNRTEACAARRDSRCRAGAIHELDAGKAVENASVQQNLPRSGFQEREAWVRA